jgi:hypothetical protein
VYAKGTVNRAVLKRYTFVDYLNGDMSAPGPKGTAAGIDAPPLQILRPDQHPVDLVLTSIVNELAAVQGVVDLVLDDYHVIDQRDVQAGMALLLEHLPPTSARDRFWPNSDLVMRVAPPDGRTVGRVVLPVDLLTVSLRSFAEPVDYARRKESV